MNDNPIYKDILSVIMLEDKEHVLVTLDCKFKHQYILQRTWFWHRKSHEMRCRQCEDLRTAAEAKRR
jgi:hypothetical protein